MIMHGNSFNLWDLSDRFVGLEGKWPATRWASRSVCVVVGLLHLVITTFLVVQICYYVLKKRIRLIFRFILTQRINYVFFPHIFFVSSLKPGLLVPQLRRPRMGGQPQKIWDFPKSWGIPKRVLDGLFPGKSHKNSWFRGTPTLGHLHMGLSETWLRLNFMFWGFGIPLCPLKKRDNAM